jgi:lysophospholipase L1-like esterase
VKRRRRSAHALLLAIVFLASLLVPSGTAGAASDYDDVFSAATSARVSDTYDSHTCASRDLATLWDDYFMDDSRWSQAVNASGADRETVQTALSAALGNGSGVAVVEREFHTVASIGNYVFDDGDTGVQVLFTPDADNEITFFTSGGLEYGTLKGTGSNPVYVVILGQYWSSSTSSCSIGVAVSRAVTSDSSNSNFVSKEAHVGMSSTANYTYRQLFINSPINQTGYEGESIPTEQPSAKYVGMGDSVSTGEGNSSFEQGTDEEDVNECHRSASAYPYWLMQTPSLNLERFSFVACSGATTANVLYGGTSDGAWNELPQVDALSQDTEVVTITIGGNDIGFGAFATACAAPSSECDSSTTIYSTTMYNIHNVLPGSLEDVLTEIADRTLHAKVYVIGYSYITPSSGLSSLPIQCSYLSSSAGDGADSLAAREVVTELNGEIGDAVSGFTNTLSGTEFEYIDPNASVDGSFDGHDLCQGLDSYFHNVAPNDVFGNGYRQKIFHPNVSGQYEYYKIVKGVMEQS